MSVETLKNSVPVISIEESRATNTIGLHPDWKKEPHKTAGVINDAAADYETPYGNRRNPRSQSGRYYTLTEGAYGFYNAFVQMFGMEPMGEGRPPVTIDVDVQDFLFRDPQGTIWNERDLNDRRMTGTKALADFVRANNPDYKFPEWNMEAHHYEFLAEAKKFMVIVGAHTRKIKVPVGTVKFPGHDDIKIILTEDDGSAFGVDYNVFQLAILAKKKDEELCDEVVAKVEEYLANYNMYQGRCFEWSDGHMNYYDPFAATNPANLAFSKRIRLALDNEVYAPIRFKEKARALDPRLVSRRILLSGDPGTGKTELANCIAQVAVQNGLTAGFLRPGSDEAELKKFQAFMTANTPGVMFVEDVESMMPDMEGLTTKQALEARSLLLSMFDGAQTKGVELHIVLTTNFEGIIASAMLRSGRLDLLLRTEAPDRESFQFLCELRIADLLPDDINYDSLWELVGDMKASFLSNGLPLKAMAYSLELKPGQRLTEEKMESLIFYLREQSDLYEKNLGDERASKKDSYTEAQQSVFRPLLDDLKNEIIESVR
jgi:hypothetical protein